MTDIAWSTPSRGRSLVGIRIARRLTAAICQRKERDLNWCLCVRLGVQLAFGPPPAEKVQLPHLLEPSVNWSDWSPTVQSAEGVDVIVVID